MLIAPVTVGENAITGAGAVVNRDVPPGASSCWCSGAYITYGSTWDGSYDRGCRKGVMVLWTVLAWPEFDFAVSRRYRFSSSPI